MKASEKYKKGKYTSCNFTTNEDGSKTITIFDPKSSGKKHVSFTVTGLNTDDEIITEDGEE